MKITWIGQAGLLIETPQATILVDPYLSDSVGRRSPEKHRRMPVKPALFDIAPDMLLFTHDHLDHYDPETAEIFLAKPNDKTVLCPTSVWNVACQNRGSNNYVCFDTGTEWTERGLHFQAVPAIHSDPYAIGFILRELATGQTIYITGDTLYGARLLRELPKDLYAVLLPVNGVGNNMNATDAARLAKATGARFAVPLHVGLFDGLTPDILAVDNRVSPQIYQEIIFPE